MSFISEYSMMSLLWSIKQHRRLMHDSLLIIAGSLLIALSAKFSIPSATVPISMQTLAALFVGMAFGWRLGGLTLLAYLVEGLAGFPVFVGNIAGPEIFLTPAAGYLIGMLPATIVVGFLMQQGWSRYYATVALAGLIGTAIIYAFGLLYLLPLMSWSQAIEVGVLPFIFSDTIKLLVLIFIIPSVWKHKI